MLRVLPVAFALMIGGAVPAFAGDLFHCDTFCGKDLLLGVPGSRAVNPAICDRHDLMVCRRNMAWDKIDASNYDRAFGREQKRVEAIGKRGADCVKRGGETRTGTAWVGGEIVGGYTISPCGDVSISVK